MQSRVLLLVGLLTLGWVANLTVSANGVGFAFPQSSGNNPRDDRPRTPVPSASRQTAIDTVLEIPNLVAFWDFVEREPDGQHRFVAHVPVGSSNRYPLDASNYIRDYWNTGREATYEDFPQSKRGPFGNAIRIVKESDPDFRPLLQVPRARLHDTPLDIKGDQSVTVVVWAIRESGNHALAGIWHEGTDLKQKETSSVARVERGQRQYALFAGLNKAGSACGHISENGGSSFLNKYALHKCNSAAQSPEIPADSPVEVLDRAWQCFAMTFDQDQHEIIGWLNGASGDRWMENPRKDTLLSSAYNAYMQAYLATIDGIQPGEDATFPSDQYYWPPEGEPIRVEVVRESDDERVERREHRYTKVEVILRDGKEVSRELVAFRLNPWWYPHAIYKPENAATGGPFTIGRVIHSSRSVGFTGWIGGVAVYDRALTEMELKSLSDLNQQQHPLPSSR
jgi:hypothetical protein